MNGPNNHSHVTLSLKIARKVTLDPPASSLFFYFVFVALNQTENHVAASTIAHPLPAHLRADGQELGLARKTPRADRLQPDYHWLHGIGMLMEPGTHHRRTSQDQRRYASVPVGWHRERASASEQFEKPIMGLHTGIHARHAKQARPSLEGPNHHGSLQPHRTPRGIRQENSAKSCQKPTAIYCNQPTTQKTNY